jgi:uncharacterized protein
MSLSFWRIGAVAVILMLFLPVLILPARGGGQVYVWMRTIHVVVPAVSYSGGVYRGVTSELVVTVAWPGSGTVYFAADPLTEIDTQAAARMAALVASMLAGVDYNSFDYFIHLKAPAPIVGGPSASGAMAVAILAALRGSNISSDFSMTGMVEPDGVLGPVGGIPEKLEAVASHGVKRFVIPLGQGYSRDLNTGRLVDVVALGRQLGVNVSLAPTILDAYVLATGDRSVIERLLHVGIPGYPYWLLSQLREISGSFLRQAEGNMTCWVKLSEKLPADYARMLGEYVVEANNSIRAARLNAGNHFYYSAASYAFRAAIDSTFLCEAAKVLTAEKPLEEAHKTIEGLVSAAERLLGQANSTISQLTAEKPTDAFVQVAVTAIIRVEDASKAIKYAESTLQELSPSNVLDALYAAVYAYYRGLTAIQWSEAAVKAATVGAPVSWQKLRDAINTFLYFARTEAEYLQALGVDVGSVYDALDTASRLVEAGSPQALLEATALTLDTTSTLTLMLHRAFSVSVRDSLNAVERSLNLLLRLSIGEYNATPIIPLLYREYSITLTEPESKLAVLVEASSYTALLASLSAKPPEKPPAGGTYAAKTVTETVTVTERATETKTVVREVTRTLTKTFTITTTSTATRTETVTSTVTSTVKETVTPTAAARGGYSGSALAAAVIASLAVGFAVGAAARRR